MALQMLPYQTLVKWAMSNGLPGNLKKVEYIDLLRLKHTGFNDEFNKLASNMKTKRRTIKKSITKKSVKKRSVGRPRKSKVKSEPLSDMENISMHTTADREMQHEQIEMCQIIKPFKCSPVISDVQICTSKSLETIVKQPTIAKTTSELLRNMLLSTNRNRIKKETSETNSSFTTPNNNSYHDCYQYDNSKPHKASSFIENSRKMKWKNLPTKNIETTVTGNNYPPDLLCFPDIPQLADVDINASFELENSNYSINDQTADINTVLCINDSDTLSNPSAQSAEHLEQDQQNFDQRWVLCMENEDITTPLDNNEIFNELDDDSLFGPQDIALIQNDVIQNYIETNNVQFMQLPDSSCEVITTLQYYEYESGLLTNTTQSPEHLQGVNEVILNEQTTQHEQTIITETNNTVAEFASMLPCPISGCLWYSHSVTLYVHLFTCHQEMIYYGNIITHVFKCQDVHDFCFFTHLQYVQNTIYIITVASDRYNNTFVTTIQHVSSYGDNTSVSPTTAILTADSCNNFDQHSWSGQVQPYSIPLDVLHADGRCLFIDPSDAEHVVIKVNLIVPWIYSNDSMFACL